MILSPDKLSMPRYTPTTNEGRITGEIFQKLKKENKEALGQLACRLDREKEVRQTDLINELVIHELQKATLHGRHVNIDEDLIRRAVMSMIPEGKKEGDRFYEVITDFKKALDAGNYELVNQIYEDPDRYGMRRFTNFFESKAAPRYNGRLQNYLKTIIERRIADLLSPDPRNPGGGPDPADAATFADMFAGISKIMHDMTLEQIPIDPVAVTGNAGLQAQINTLLGTQAGSGVRPKVYEALRLNLVAPGSIDPGVDRVARQFAGERGSELMGEQTASFEEQARVLSRPGTRTSGYNTLVGQVEAIDPEQSRLLDLLDDTPQPKIRFPNESRRRFAERQGRYDRLPDRLKNIEGFVDAVQKEVFEPFAALTIADRATLSTARAELETAKKNLDKARAAGNGADITRYSADTLRHQHTVDTLFERISRMSVPQFGSFLRIRVRPLLFQQLCHSLLEGIDSYKTMRAEVLKIRTMPNISYVYQLVDLKTLHDSTFRNMYLIPIIRARLGRSAVPIVERQALIDAEVTTDYELGLWGL
ncbi:hypothetical protein HY732_02320 [Candidatus Uhrbacteria bacterium]|nr:hypothetical protein [Candidatus Uhrbacteria bacterium]